jgi:hypothetical protein
MLAILPIAMAAGLWLNVAGEPWSLTDWVENILILGLVILATIIISDRQHQLQRTQTELQRLAADLQRALADTSLVESISAINGAVYRIRDSLYAASVRQLLTDIRAGLHLFRYGHRLEQEEYLGTSEAAVHEVLEQVENSVRPYGVWSHHDWVSIERAAQRLVDAVDQLVTLTDEDALTSVAAMKEALHRLAAVAQKYPEVSFDTFRRSYEGRGVRLILHAMLDWKRLADYIANHQASIRVHRDTSLAWLADRTVYASWYETPDGEFTTYPEDGATPLTLNDYLGRLPDDWQRKVAAVANSFEAATDVGVVPVVTLEIPERRLIVLDGRYRLAAIYLERPGRITSIEAEIVEFRITAPMDARLLPDLRHHVAGATE